jgi:TRAP-type C4-dicarboxylate transport system substrate-binding protein
MLRRATPLLLAAFVVLFALAPEGALDAQDTPPASGTARTLGIATLAPPGSVIVRGLEAWNRELRRRTGGSLQFRFYTGGVQGDDPEVVRKIRSGRLDGGTLTSTGLAQIYRPALVFQMPGTFLHYEQLDAARAALQPEIDAGIIAAGFRMLGWSDVGQARLFSQRRIARPSEMAGTHLWQRDDDVILPALVSRVHASPVELGVPEVLGALQTHRIDTFLAPPAVAIALQWSGHAQYVNEIPMSIIIGGMVLSESVFQSLTAEQQAVLRETGEQFHALGRRNSRRMETESIHALGEHGIQVVTTTEAERNEWRELGRQVREATASQIASPDLVARAAAFGEH